MRIPLLLLALSLLPAPSLSKPQARVTMTAASGVYQPGQPVRVAFSFRIEKGWHTYWLNPGTAGEPASVQWTLPEGWKSLGLEFPAPGRIEEEHSVSFGYQDGVVLFDTLIPPSTAGAGPVKLRAKLTWLVCREVCLGEEAAFILVLDRGKRKNLDPGFLGLYDQWRGRLPREDPSLEPVLKKRWFGKGWTLRVKDGAALDRAEFIPLNREGVDISRPITGKHSEGWWTFEIPADPSVPFKGRSLRGLLVPQGASPNSTFEVSVPIP